MIAGEDSACRIVGGVDTTCTSPPSSMSRISSLHPAALQRPARATGRCSPGCSTFGELQRVGVASTSSYGAGLPRCLQQAGGEVLEVTPMA